METSTVPGEDNGASEAKAQKKAPTPRAAKALPTDRMKFDAQVESLMAFVIESNNGQRAVTAAEIAPHIGVVEATAALNNTFFVDAGLIARESKGRYKPTAATIEFSRSFGFDPESAKAKLGEPLAKTWFYETVRDRVGMGNATRDRVIHVLASKAGAAAGHSAKLDALLEWLEYALLIKIDGNKVELLDAPAPDPSQAGDPATTPADKQQGKEVPQTPAGHDGSGKGTTKGPAVLEFNFSCSLSAEDLAKLEPDQITALYSAVGGVMAVQAKLNAAAEKAK